MSRIDAPAAPSRPAAPARDARRAVPELRALTGARGIAAWLVVLFHLRLSIAGLPGWAGAVLAQGYLAVDFFFLLSGFVLWLNYAPRLRAGGIAAVPGFLRRRIARIWPLHLFILGGALALALMLRATGRATPQFPMAELPLHILLVQNWGFTRALAWNDPAWSISCEFAAYLLFPAIAMAVDWRRLPVAARLAVLAAMFAALDAILTRAGATTLGDDIPRLGLVRCLIEFAAGAWSRRSGPNGADGAARRSSRRRWRWRWPPHGSAARCARRWRCPPRSPRCCSRWRSTPNGRATGWEARCRTRWARRAMPPIWGIT